ncbi:MAG: hypothetical protein QM756_23985 [Polyangiaceae bacterium]
MEVDRHAAVAVLEAGVSYDALRAHLEQRDLPLCTAADANGARAVVGGLLERQWAVGPWGEREAWRCGLEAVLRNGALLRSGMGALPGNGTWARTRYAYGPALDGLFTRSALGIVTRYGLWLAPRPERLLPFMLELVSEVAIGAAVEALRPLLLDGTLTGTVGIASAAWDAALLSASGSRAPVSAGWRLYGALAGRGQRVAARWSRLRAVLAALPGAQLADETNAGGDRAGKCANSCCAAPPCTTTIPGRDGDAIAFTVVAPPTAADARALLRIVDTGLAGQDARLEFRQGPRALRLELALNSGARNQSLRRGLALKVVAELVKAGYGIAWATPDLDDAVEIRHVDDELRELHMTLRAALIRLRRAARPHRATSPPPRRARRRHEP